MKYITGSKLYDYIQCPHKEEILRDRPWKNFIIALADPSEKSIGKYSL